ncbi:hypothetical protein MPTK1_1g02990 [Marchantia polymorpha subsp. ruderalis]|uniref:Uncharacterized protein n=1 Tax=Marchantia polymorpha subsp. ruderalis TaxID=1480154 RepID=A0AAF6AKX6_MARPO|nr:hypothetical protein Mp_1g02990 [Marchantia polymorpha subsp. ruderalis]
MLCGNCDCCRSKCARRPTRSLRQVDATRERDRRGMIATAFGLYTGICSYG